MAFAPDGRIFVCEQSGAVRVVKNGALLATPFTTVTTDATLERGLIGITTDPNFAVNSYVYIYYTVPGNPAHNRVSRFTASGDVATGAETVILELPNLTNTSHNGGQLAFGSDGKLYVAVGDDRVGSNAQSTLNLFGKVLRVNSDGTIPADNPFYNSASGNNRAIWALGLRNPYTMAFQNGTGRLFINDVGESAWEEINDGVAGYNYGWPAAEGNTPNPAYRTPIYSYGHGTSLTNGCAIIGGAFYNPSTVRYPSSYVGQYFFSDACSGWIRYLDPAVSSPPTQLFATGTRLPVHIDLGPDGYLYYLSRTDGTVYRIAYDATAKNPTAVSRLTTAGITLTPANSSWPINAPDGLFDGTPASGQDGSRNTYVAAMDTFGGVYANIFNAATQSWGNWVLGYGKFQGSPAIAVTSDGTAYIAARDLFGSYWISTFRSNQGFTPWVYLAGIFGSDPSIALAPDGTVYLAGRDTFGSFWSARYLSNGDFRGWRYGAGVFKGQPAITIGPNNTAYIAGRDTYDSLWMATVSGDVWSNWTFGQGIMVADPQLVFDGNNTIYAVVAGQGGLIWYRPWVVNSGWTNWVSTSGLVTNFAAAIGLGSLHVTGFDAANQQWWYVGNRWIPSGLTYFTQGLSASPR